MSQNSEVAVVQAELLEILDLGAGALRSSAKLVEDLGVDSLQMYEIVALFASRGWTVPEQLISSWQTLSDLEQFILSRAADNHS